VQTETRAVRCIYRCAGKGIDASASGVGVVAIIEGLWTLRAFASPWKSKSPVFFSFLGSTHHAGGRSGLARPPVKPSAGRRRLAPRDRWRDSVAGRNGGRPNLRHAWTRPSSGRGQDRRSSARGRRDRNSEGRPALLPIQIPSPDPAREPDPRVPEKSPAEITPARRGDCRRKSRGRRSWSSCSCGSAGDILSGSASREEHFAAARRRTGRLPPLGATSGAGSSAPSAAGLIAEPISSVVRWTTHCSSASSRPAHAPGNRVIKKTAPNCGRSGKRDRRDPRGPERDRRGRRSLVRSFGRPAATTPHCPLQITTDARPWARIAARRGPYRMQFETHPGPKEFGPIGAGREERVRKSHGALHGRDRESRGAEIPAAWLWMHKPLAHEAGRVVRQMSVFSCSVLAPGFSTEN